MKEEIIREIRKYFELNEIKIKNIKIVLWNKIVICREIYSIKCIIRHKESSQINDNNFHF